MLHAKPLTQAVNIHPANTLLTILPTTHLHRAQRHNRALLINTSILLMEDPNMGTRLPMTHMQKILATVVDIMAVRDPRM